MLMKGSVLDVIVIPIVAFILFFTVVFVYMFLSQFNTIASDVLTIQAQQSLQAGLNQFLFWDQAIIILIGGLFVVTLVAAAMVNAHPIFFVGAVLFLIISVILGAQITNIFIAIAGNAGISSTANLFPLTIQFFQNLPLFMLVFTIAIAVVMFSFGGRESGARY